MESNVNILKYKMEWTSVIDNFFIVNDIPKEIIHKCEKISNGFSKCNKYCIDGKYVVELHKINETRRRNVKAKIEKVSQIKNIFRDIIRESSQEKRKGLAIMGLQKSCDMVKELCKLKHQDSEDISNMLADIANTRRVINPSTSSNKRYIFTWDDNPIFIQCDKRETTQCYTQCKHGLSCKWYEIWICFSNDKMPREFCDQMAGISINFNHIDS